MHFISFARKMIDSTVVSSQPKSNIEQAVGRILRQEVKDRKFVPLVIDISDSFCSMFASQGKKRIKFYEKMVRMNILLIKY